MNDLLYVGQDGLYPLLCPVMTIIHMVQILTKIVPLAVPSYDSYTHDTTTNIDCAPLCAQL